MQTLNRIALSYFCHNLTPYWTLEAYSASSSVARSGARKPPPLMIAIGGKTKTKKVNPTQPQFVVQIAEHINEYALIRTNDLGQLQVLWIGDPNAATKFDSKYSAKFRTRELVDIPSTRCFRQLGA